MLKNVLEIEIENSVPSPSTFLSSEELYVKIGEVLLYDKQ